MATMPSSASSAPSNQLRFTQAKGATKAPKISAATFWIVTSTMPGVPRTSRVHTMKIENEKLPAIATKAAGDNAPVVGFNAIITPTKPATTAAQRRQPTFSSSRKGDTAVT